MFALVRALRPVDAARGSERPIRAGHATILWYLMNVFESRWGYCFLAWSQGKTVGSQHLRATPLATMGVTVASIQHRQRTDGTVAYRVMFRENSGSGVVSETFDTAGEADYFKQLVERIGGAAARAKRAQADNRHGKTMAEVLDSYLESAPDITPGTASEYRRILARTGLADITGDVGVELIDRADIEAWVRHRSTTPSTRTKRPPAAKTVANEHGLISTILTHAVERGWRASNPAKGVRLPKHHKAELELLDTAEFLALHDAITERYRPLVWLLGATGLRWGEATALQWRDIGNDTITVRQAWKHDESHGRVLGPPKTRRAMRRIETSKTVIASLGQRGAPNDYVFTNTRGDAIKYSTFWESHWKPACQRANLAPAPTIHGLRHFAASYMLSQGSDIFEVSRALGHESVSTTSDVYGHLVRARTRPTATHAAALEAARAGQITT